MLDFFDKACSMEHIKLSVRDEIIKLNSENKKDHTLKHLNRESKTCVRELRFLEHKSSTSF